jgi:hypothetical protein
MDLYGGERIRTQVIYRNSLRNAEFNQEFENRSKAMLVSLVGQAISRIDFVKSHEEQIKKMGIDYSATTQPATTQTIPGDSSAFEDMYEDYM